MWGLVYTQSNYSIVECLLYSFHALGGTVPSLLPLLCGIEVNKRAMFTGQVSASPITTAHTVGGKHADINPCHTVNTHSPVTLWTRPL